MNPTGILSATDEAITIRMYVCMYAVSSLPQGAPLCMRSCCERHRNSPVTWWSPSYAYRWIGVDMCQLSSAIGEVTAQRATESLQSHITGTMGPHWNGFWLQPDLSRSVKSYLIKWWSGHPAPDACVHRPNHTTTTRHLTGLYWEIQQRVSGVRRQQGNYWSEDNLRYKLETNRG